MGRQRLPHHARREPKGEIPLSILSRSPLAWFWRLANAAEDRTPIPWPNQGRNHGHECVKFGVLRCGTGESDCPLVALNSTLGEIGVGHRVWEAGVHVDRLFRSAGLPRVIFSVSDGNDGYSSGLRGYAIAEELRNFG